MCEKGTMTRRSGRPEYHFVELPAALRADLDALTEALGDPGTDLTALVGAVTADIRLAIASYLGMSLTLIVDGYPLTFTLMDEAAWAAGAIDAVGAADAPVIGSSVVLPLPAICAAEPGSALVLYAAKPGAFVDLVADLSYAVGLALDEFVLDAHLEPPAGGSALYELSQVNLAIGILIERGHTIDDAHTELQRRAQRHQITVHAAARALVQALRG
jgi:hypothetical protein